MNPNPNISDISHTYVTQVKKKGYFLTKVIACSRFKDSQRLLVVRQTPWRAKERCSAWLLQRFEAPSASNSVVMSIGVHQRRTLICHRFVFISASCICTPRFKSDDIKQNTSCATSLCRLKPGRRRAAASGAVGRPKCEADVCNLISVLRVEISRL